MDSISVKTSKAFLLTGACITWLAVILQLYLIILNRTTSVGETIIRFFSFFTILTNIMVAVCFTFILVNPVSKKGKFFTLPSTLTAVSVYIAVTGIVYNMILRFLWSPKGLQFIVDELLHSIVPLFFVVFWVVFVPKETLKWKDIFPWIMYPAVYCIYSLIRGAISGFYPYPFIDVNVLGYNKVLINIAGMIILFVAISILFMGIAKITIRRTGNKNS